jgi:hypothetical protein
VWLRSPDIGRDGQKCGCAHSDVLTSAGVTPRFLAECVDLDLQSLEAVLLADQSLRAQVHAVCARGQRDLDLNFDVSIGHM